MNNWIWLDAERHPDKQTCAYTGNWESRDGCGVVVELSRRYGFGKKIEKIELRYSSDSVSQLWVNKRFIGRRRFPRQRASEAE